MGEGNDRKRCDRARAPEPYHAERALGDQLRRTYREAIEEGVPHDLRQLLDRLGDVDGSAI